jgi:hypothetical protein
MRERTNITLTRSASWFQTSETSSRLSDHSYDQLDQQYNQIFDRDPFHFLLGDSKISIWGSHFGYGMESGKGGDINIFSTLGGYSRGLIVLITYV